MPNSLVIVFAGSRETSLTGECTSRSRGFKEPVSSSWSRKSLERIYALKINRSIFSRIEKDTQEF